MDLKEGRVGRIPGREFGKRIVQGVSPSYENKADYSFYKIILLPCNLVVSVK